MRHDLVTCETEKKRGKEWEGQERKLERRKKGENERRKEGKGR